MQTRVHIDNHWPDNVTVHLIVDYDEQEQQALALNNNWHRPCMGYIDASLGLFKGTWRHNAPKFYEFAYPGLIVQSVTASVAANLEQNFLRRDTNIIARALSQIILEWKNYVRATLVEQRNAQFGVGKSDPHSFLPAPPRQFASVATPMIDVTPHAPNQQVLLQRPLQAPIVDIPRGLPVIQKPSLDGVPIMRHSRINLADFLRHRIAPETPPSFPDVEGMEWWFDEPEPDDDNEIRLYLALSPEYIARTKRFGIEHQVFGDEEPLADDPTLDRIQQAQDYELNMTADPHVRAALQIEHKQMLAWLRGQKMGLTIADFRAFPYRKVFANRLQAIRGQQKINGHMSDLRKMLERNNG